MIIILLEFAIVLLQLLMFKVSGIIGISSFSIVLVLKGLNKIKRKIKTHSKPPKFVSQSFFKKFQQMENMFLVFHCKFNTNGNKLILNTVNI